MADVEITPNPAEPEQDTTLTGCGYEMKPVEVHINGAFAFAIGMRSTPQGACLDSNHFPAPDQPGSYKIELFQQRDHGKKKNLAAETTLVVR
jgi:hypothetical protein